jgi:hypothetical protein
VTVANKISASALANQHKLQHIEVLFAFNQMFELFRWANEGRESMPSKDWTRINGALPPRSPTTAHPVFIMLSNADKAKQAVTSNDQVNDHQIDL